jgi:uncharacterized protein YicC (UPF0701 family)
MTAFETAHVECRCFGRTLDAETTDKLLREIEELTGELTAEQKRSEARGDALQDLIRAAQWAIEDLDAFTLGRYIEGETIAKHIEPKIVRLAAEVKDAKKCA